MAAKHEAAEEQFPSDKGEDKVENAERTADTDKSEASVFKKDFVVLITDAYEVLERDGLHLANKLRVLEEAIQHGLHPTGEPRFDGETDQDRTRIGTNKVFSYSVDVIPAHVDHDAASTVVPGNLAKEADQTDCKDAKKKG